MSDVQQPPGTTVVPANGQHVVEAPDDFLTRMAINPAIDAEKLKTLAETYIRTREKQREWEAADRAEQARALFFTARAAMQAEMPVLDKDTPNPNTGSKYTDYGDIWESCSPVWAKHGFGVSFDIIPLDTGLIRVKAIITHAAGHQEEYLAPDTPPDTMGPRGTPNKTVVQGNQATITYVQRGLLCRAIGIAMRREEDDGSSGSREDGGGRPRSQGADRRDEVKREPPPPRDDSRPPPPTADWRQRLARGEREEVERLKRAFASEPTAEKLEELVTIVRELIDQAPKPVQVDVAAALGAARKRLKNKTSTSVFEFVVFDSSGESLDGELISDPVRWAHQMVGVWGRTPDFEKPNLLHHNADALEVARTIPAAAPLLAEVNEAPDLPPDTTVAHGVSPFDEAVAMAEPPRDEDTVWVDNQLATIRQIPIDAAGRRRFDTLVAEIRPRIAKLRGSREELFTRINSEFTAKHNTLPAAAA